MLRPSSAARLLVGALVTGIGVALNARSEIGFGALYVLQEGLERMTGHGFAVTTVVVGMVMVLAANLLGVRPGPGTVGGVVLVGAFGDLAMAVAPAIPGATARAVALLVSPVVMTLGATLMVTARAGVEPINALMFAIHRHVSASLPTVRLVMEVAMAGVGWLLGGTVGVGCVVISLTVGPLMQVWLRVWGQLPPAPAVPAEP